MAEQNLKDKTVKGVAWSGLDNIIQLGTSFVVSIVLARLLSPDDYGLIGIVTIFSTICNALISGGFGSALIRKNNTSDDDYSTVFIVNVTVSIVLYSLLFFISPYIANYFERGELVMLTRVTTISIVIGALSIVPQTRLTKELDFKTQTRITFISSIIGGLTGIVLAFCSFGVWALVAQNLCSQLLRTVSLLLQNKSPIQWRFSFLSFKELFGFGWKLMLVSLIDSIWKEIYQVIIGKYYNLATLGQYTRANQFSQLFSSNLTGVVQRVSFPVLSSIQDDTTRMVAAYRRIIKTTMFITAVSMFALGAVSEPLLYCLIGDKWRVAATYLPLICVAGSLFPLHAINLNMLEVQGRSDLFLGIEIVKKTLFLIPLFIGAVVGIMPMLLANIITSIMSFFINSFFTGKLLGYSSWMQIKDVLPSYFVAIIVALSVWFLKGLPISNWIILPTQILVGSIVFFIICRLYRLEEYNETKEMITTLLKKNKKKE